MPKSLGDSHPTPELLQRLASGELNGPEADAIRGHVDSCDECSEKLREQDPVRARHSGNEPTGDYLPDTSSPRIDAVGNLPERVGRYRLECEIARGGMGRVVRVTDEVFQRPLAMKIALGPDQMSAEARERFAREALLTGQLQHPGIPPVQEMGQFEDGRPYFIMKLVKGSDLGKLLRKRSSTGADLPRFVAVFEQVCQTLGYAHSHGIIHRDLKPGNVMVGAFGEVQVMDWGLAKLLTPDSRSPDYPEKPAQPKTVFTVLAPNSAPQETLPGTVMGTSAYMPPEQARGEAETLDTRCDVFGLGGILCEILTGKPPFPEKASLDNQRLSMKGDLSDAFARLNACGAESDLVNLAKQCLASERENRPAHAGIVAEAVARYQAALQERMKQAEIAKAAALVRVGEERKRRRVSLALAAALVLLVVGAGAGVLWYQGEMARQDEEKIRQDGDRNRQKQELALRREYLNKEVSSAVADAEQRRQVQLEKLTKQSSVNELLSDIDHWQASVNETRAAWQRAEALAAGSPDLIEPALATRLQNLKANLVADEKDWKFAKACDNARLEAATSVNGKWNPAVATQRYPDIFSRAGLAVITGDVAELADKIKKSPIRLVYLATLDDWADHATSDTKLLSRLLSIANGADSDPWRIDFRHVETWKDTAKLQALARKVDFQQQSPQILLSLGRCLIKSDDSNRHPPKDGEGSQLLRKVRRDHPRDFWIAFSLGNLLADPIEREGCYRAALAIRPLSDAAHYNLGIALADKKDVEGALWQHRKALDINPQFAEAHVNLGTLLHAKNDEKQAIQHYNTALAINPKLIQAHLDLGVILVERNDVEGAISHYRKALEIDPNSAPAHVNLGGAFLAKQNLQEGLKCIRKALEIDPNQAEAHFSLGVYYDAVKDLKGAVKSYREAVELKPAQAKFHYNLARALSAKKDMAGAIEHYRKTIEVDPGHFQAHSNLGNALKDKKDIEGAIKHFRIALQIKPDEAIIHGNLGVALSAKKDADGAIEHFRKAIELNPKSAKYHISLAAVFFLQKKNMKESARHYGKALEIDPNNAQVHGFLGLALHAMRDVDGAMAHHRKAVEINPNDPFGDYNLGKIFLFEKKDPEQAIKHYRKAIAVNPKLTDARNGLGLAYGASCRALLEKGHLAEARAAAAERLGLLAAGNPQRKLAQEQLQRCDQLLAADKKLALILKGEPPPDSAAELLELAQLCRDYKHSYGAAARFYAAALEKDPRLADSTQNNQRQSYAGAALLAAAGKGKNAENFSDQDRTKLRSQALDWLRADLALLRKKSQAGTVLEVFLLTQKLSLLQSDPVPASVRDGKDLAGLAKQEQEPWRRYWVDVAQVTKETKARLIETQYQGTLTAKQVERVYEVKMLAGKTYLLDLQSSAFDAYIRLEDVEGKILAENDDISPDNQNSRLEFCPKVAGAYRVIATSFQQQGVGTYLLTIREFADPHRLQKK